MDASLLDVGTYVSLLKIMGINILLSGDNAVVIALSCHTLPLDQRRIAITIGTLCAIVLRIVLTGVAAFLLTLPYLKLLGGLLLFWIALKFLLPESEDGTPEGSSTRLLAAIRTIVFADLVMSLDNVIGVAAVAGGSLFLLTFGLLLSMPIIIFGSTIMLKALARFPLLVTAGAALIGYLSGELVFSDPCVHRWTESQLAGLSIWGPMGVSLVVVATGRLWTTWKKERLCLERRQG